MIFDLLAAAIARQHPVQLPVDGARLKACGDGAWVADRELAFGGSSRMPIRMVVLADPPGELHGDVNEGDEPIEVIVVQMKDAGGS